MRTARAALALLLTLAVPVRAETTSDPLWTLLSTYVLTPDPRSPGEGEGDSKGLAALQADLQLMADGFEAFRDETQVKESLVRLEPRMSPELRPFFKDRASSLGSVYRTLAVIDYSWAGRLPEPPCGPAERRAALLAAEDGLFADEKGDASPWLVALLGPQAKGKKAAAALDEASAAAPLTPAEYERLRARVRRLTLALASERADGAVRAKLYCERAAAYESLAARHPGRDRGLVEASASAASSVAPSVFAVVSGSRRAAAVALMTESGSAVVTDADIVSGTDAPRVFAPGLDGRPVEVAAKVKRRHPVLGLAELELSVARPALRLAENAPVKGELVSVIGHSEVSGLWTRSSGLVTKAGNASFQTDAALGPDFSGAPVLDEAGAVAGLLVLRKADTEEGRWPVAVPAPLLARWLEGEEPGAAEPAAETIEDSGTAAILTRAAPAPIESGLGAWDIPSLPPPPPTVQGVCVSGCNIPSAPRRSYSRSPSYSGGSTYSPGAEMGAELGKALAPLVEALVFQGIPALFRGIGSLFKKRHNSGSAARSADRKPAQKAETKKEPPARPKPPKLESLILSLSPDELLEGEELEAVATLIFSGEKPTKDGIVVSFQFAGKTHHAATDPSGTATFKLKIEPKPDRERTREFNELSDEAAGEHSAYLTPEGVTASTRDSLRKRTDAAFASLDGEAQAGDEAEEPADSDSDLFTEWDGDLDHAPENAAAGMTAHAAPNLPSPSLEKLYDLHVKASASAGEMGTAADSSNASVMSNRCPKGTVALEADPPPGGSPGTTPGSRLDKAELDKLCRDNEQVANDACTSSLSVRLCKDAVLHLLDYDFRGCIKRWDPDGPGSAGSSGSAYPPSRRRTPPSKRCVPIEQAQRLRLDVPTIHVRGLGSGTKRPISAAVTASWRALIKQFLAGARFLKNVTHAIFEVQGGLRRLTDLFDAATQGQKVESRPGGIKIARLPDGTTLALRPMSSAGPATLQVSGPGGQKVKIRAP